MYSRSIFILIITSLTLSIKAYSQFDPSPELDWFTIETKHFYIHYHNGAERTANVVAKIAEEIYGPVTSLYQFKPSDKTSLIINDESDYSSGATDYYGNRIEISSTALDFDLRGTHNWLRNVITHEFIHVIQVQLSLKFSTKLPSVYLQWINYEGERRPDVLYGYPNIIVSYPISGVGVPAWFAEGTSQYQRQQLGYDYWDSHRDMILRMRTLGNNLLSWEEMGQFASVTTYKAESIYNHGFALVRYISEKYGENKLKEISKNLGEILTYNSESAFKRAIGKTGKELYREWKSYLEKDYKERTANLKGFLIEGEPIAKIGFANYYPQFSPDGKKISYLSNKTSDYGSTSLFIHNLNSNKKDEILVTSVSGNYGWSPDGKKIVFARRNKPTIYEKSIFDIYEFDIESKKEKRLTYGLRAHATSYSADGKYICFVENNDGTQNLYIAELPQRGLRPKEDRINEVTQLTNFTNGEQIYAPKWSPDGKHIIFDYSKNSSRSIARIDVSTGRFEFLFEDRNIDFRSPSYTSDGRQIILSADITGIYNVYLYDLSNEAEGIKSQERINNLKQITNTVGGAFMPSSDKDGSLTYASFTSVGYQIYLLKDYKEIDSTIAERKSVYSRPEKLIVKYAAQNDSNSTQPKNKFNWTMLKDFDDSIPNLKPKTNYNNATTPLFLIPVLRFDNYTKSGKFLDAIKPGLYFYSQDVLGRMGIIGGAFLNKNFERDLFLQFEYNNGVPFLKDFFIKKLSFIPKFTLAGYNITRKTDAELIAGLDTVPVGITYDLMQFDFLMAFKIINSKHKVKAGFTISKYTSKLSAFVIPSANLSVPSTSNNYFTGRDLSLTYIFSDFKGYKNDDINPIGRYVKLRYDYEFNSLNPQLVINDQGNLVEEFEKANFHRLEGDWLQSFSVFKSHSIGFRLRGGTIFGHEQDNFFDFYASGFPGMKGYPFYAIGGNRYASANLTYRLPIVEGLNIKFLQFYFDKIYFSIYGDFGNAWNSKAVKLKDFKKDIGAELRIGAFSYYAYPTSIAFNLAYGLDEFTRHFPTGSSVNKEVNYGKEFRFYFTILFGFDFMENVFKKF